MDYSRERSELHQAPSLPWRRILMKLPVRFGSVRFPVRPVPVPPVPVPVLPVPVQKQKKKSRFSTPNHAQINPKSCPNDTQMMSK